MWKPHRLSCLLAVSCCNISYTSTQQTARFAKQLQTWRQSSKTRTKPKISTRHVLQKPLIFVETFIPTMRWYTFLQKGLFPVVQPIVEPFRRWQPSYAITFNRFFAFSRDEGDSKRTFQSKKCAFRVPNEHAHVGLHTRRSCYSNDSHKPTTDETRRIYDVFRWFIIIRRILSRQKRLKLRSLARRAEEEDILEESINTYYLPSTNTFSEREEANQILPLSRNKHRQQPSP